MSLNYKGDAVSSGKIGSSVCFPVLRIYCLVEAEQKCGTVRNSEMVTQRGHSYEPGAVCAVAIICVIIASQLSRVEPKGEGCISFSETIAPPPILRGGL